MHVCPVLVWVHMSVGTRVRVYLWVHMSMGTCGYVCVGTYMWVHVCGYMGDYMGVDAHECRYMWQPEVDARCFLHLLLHLIFETLRLTWEAPGNFLSISPGMGFLVCTFLPFTQEPGP